MLRIKLNDGSYTIVDKDSYELYQNKKWIKMAGYAGLSQNGKNIYLHRLIAGTPKGLVTDHINGDKLDNRKQNLRVCTYAENNRNSKKQNNGKGLYKGITKMGKKWRAQIWYEDKIYLLGVHKTQEEAALAYNKKAVELHKDFARLNVIVK